MGPLKLQFKTNLCICRQECRKRMCKSAALHCLQQITTEPIDVLQGEIRQCSEEGVEMRTGNPRYSLDGRAKYTQTH